MCASEVAPSEADDSFADPAILARELADVSHKYWYAINAHLLKMQEARRVLKDLDAKKEKTFEEYIAKNKLAGTSCGSVAIQLRAEAARIFEEYDRLTTMSHSQHAKIRCHKSAAWTLQEQFSQLTSKACRAQSDHIFAVVQNKHQ